MEMKLSYTVYDTQIKRNVAMGEKVAKEKPCGERDGFQHKVL